MFCNVASTRCGGTKSCAKVTITQRQAIVDSRHAQMGNETDASLISSLSALGFFSLALSLTRGQLKNGNCGAAEKKNNAFHP